MTQSEPKLPRRSDYKRSARRAVDRQAAGYGRAADCLSTDECFRGIELGGDEFAMPTENRFGRDDAGNLLQSRLTKLLAGRRQRDALFVRPLRSQLDLVSQNAVFSKEVFDLESQFVTDLACNE